jgi:hypothetical protein
VILNLLHRPETPAFDALFQWQQRLAHDLKLKVTVMVDLANLQRADMVAAIKSDAAAHGDEIGFWFSAPGQVIADADNGGAEPFLWLYDRDDKARIIAGCLERFERVFGFKPKTVGSYHMDAESLGLLKSISPETRITIAGCFEEGVRVFHGCNHSWYLFNEGMPWNPWWPSRGHSLRPASSPEDAVDIVAVPHLIRDLVLSVEGRNDFFASHPQNIQRAMANDGARHDYDYNLLLQHQLQEDFNDGYSWAHVFVGPNWLSNNHNIEDSDEITQGIYREYLEHFALERDAGRVTDMHMTEFADWFRAARPPGTPQVALAKDVLYGSDKHYVWYVDGNLRATLDATQGGSLCDLRPYAARFASSTGPHTDAMAMGSYPYLIHSQHRTGFPNHFRDGARTTALVTLEDETIDLCTCPTRVEGLERDGHGTHVHFSPAALEFAVGTVTLETRVRFAPGGEIHVTRRVRLPDGFTGHASLTEYVKACYGYTEYPEKLHGVQLEVDGTDATSLEFAYKSRSRRSSGATHATAVVPQIGARLSLETAQASVAGEILEGFIFSPFYTLKLEFDLRQSQEVTTCLRVSPA